MASRWRQPIAAPTADDAEGRFAFMITFTDGHTTEVQMPGIPIEQVRFLGNRAQNIWRFPRLYVNGESGVWSIALGICGADDEDE